MMCPEQPTIGPGGPLGAVVFEAMRRAGVGQAKSRAIFNQCFHLDGHHCIRRQSAQRAARADRHGGAGECVEA